jgi:DNA ligase-1
MMLAARYRDEDPTGWLASEKLDGCRAFWDGQVLRTRSWLPIRAPAWFTARLPAGVALDGEIWAGRGTFQKTKVLVQFDRQNDPAWLQTRFMVFDWPTDEGTRLEERLALAKDAALKAGAGWVEQTRVLGRADMWARFASVVSGGGEGLVLRRPGSLYDFGRSADWLKVKPAGVD